MGRPVLEFQKNKTAKNTTNKAPHMNLEERGDEGIFVGRSVVVGFVMGFGIGDAEVFAACGDVGRECVELWFWVGGGGFGLGEGVRCSGRGCEIATKCVSSSGIMSSLLVVLGASSLCTGGVGAFWVDKVGEDFSMLSFVGAGCTVLRELIEAKRTFPDSVPFDV